MKRRDFILKASLASVASFAAPSLIIRKDRNFTSKRPSIAERKFTSTVIEDVISDTKKKIEDKEIAWLFENCFPNTLDTTVYAHTTGLRPDTFIITGDIEAMWLRDSSAQVWPYLPYANQDPKLKTLLAGVINRQTDCILMDPYANAFNLKAQKSHWMSDDTKMTEMLHERKYELDSICYPIRLAHGYWKATQDKSPFDDKWLKAMKLIVATMKEQQRFENSGPYHFRRKTARAHDTAYGRSGKGSPVKPTGLIASVFRPSDDATVFLNLIPSNLFAVVVLNQLAEMVSAIHNDKAFATEATGLAKQVSEALTKFAIHAHPEKGDIYAFEVDGYGSRIFIDDANVPSLLSLPYLQAVDAQDKIYKNTRNFVLSKSNPYFYEGTAASGVGSPHTDDHNIWPMSIIMRALTSENEGEIENCIRMLKNTHAGTGFMHESFNKDRPEIFTREWFAWANTLFGELILKQSKMI